MSVKRILAEKGRDVVTIEPQISVGDAAAVLAKRRIGAAVVLDEAGAVIGIFTERDLVRAVGEKGAASLADAVADRMTRDVITCRQDATIDELMELMTTRKFRHVPVVEQGRLDGIVSIGDVVKHRIAAVEAEHKALRDYITAA